MTSGVAGFATRDVHGFPLLDISSESSVMRSLLTRSLQFDSISGNEGPFTRFIAEWARTAGFEIDLWQGDESAMADYPLASCAAHPAGPSTNAGNHLPGQPGCRAAWPQPDVQRSFRCRWRAGRRSVDASAVCRSVRGREIFWPRSVRCEGAAGVGTRGDAGDSPRVSAWSGGVGFAGTRAGRGRLCRTWHADKRGARASGRWRDRAGANRRRAAIGLPRGLPV